jgi:phosphatidate cytidylyltransferase
MVPRIISAFVGIPIVMTAVWAGLPWLSLLGAILASLGALEFYRMAQKREARPAVLPGIAWALAFVVNGHGNDWPATGVALGGAAITLLWHQLWRLVALPIFARFGVVHRSFGDAIVDWVYTAAGAFYIGWTLSLFLLLRVEANGLAWVMVVVLGSFATDTGALIIGKSFGRRALAPRISPGKTWEGAIGGFILGIGAVLALASLLELPVSMLESVALGALVGVSAQVGDLMESMIKRASGVKDAGRMIPGHGGILDRLDSVVFVIVVVYHFFILVIK